MASCNLNRPLHRCLRVREYACHGLLPSPPEKRHITCNLNRTHHVLTKGLDGKALMGRLDMPRDAELWSFALGCSRGEVQWTLVYSFPDCSGRFGIYRARGRSARDAVQRGQYSGKRRYANFFV